MISISKEANPNYLAKIVELKNVQKHSNADKLQTVNIDFQTVITGMDAKEGMIYVYFPVECALNKQFLSYTNSFRDKSLNSNSESVGFFEDHGRVKALRLRGEKSMGYIVPINIIEEFTNVKNLSQFVGEEFDTVGEVKMLTKYIAKNTQTQGSGKERKSKSPKLDRLIAGQVNLHIDTHNLRKNINQINPDDVISVTYKTHGTSWWVSNVLVKRKLSLLERFSRKFGIRVQETEYDLVYGSRKVVKNQYLEDPKSKDHFFGYDIWNDIKDTIKESVPKGFTVYGECLGYDKNGKAIQGGYDYGCKGSEFKLEVYRVTQTTPDGMVTELSYPQIAAFCEKANLTPSHLFYSGVAKDIYPELKIHLPQEGDPTNIWRNELLKNLERDYNEKDCFMCSVKAPEEGIVVRKENLFSCNSFKLKSFRFLEYESKELDKGTVDIES